ADYVEATYASPVRSSLRLAPSRSLAARNFGRTEWPKEKFLAEVERIGKETSCARLLDVQAELLDLLQIMDTGPRAEFDAAGQKASYKIYLPRVSEAVLRVEASGKVYAFW